MRLFVIFYFILFCNSIFCQNINDREFKLQFESQLQNFNFKTKEINFLSYSVFKVQNNNQSIFNNKEKFNEIIVNKQFQKNIFRLPEKQIDYNQIMFQCGALEPNNSKDMMISAFKYYILNKYILSLFVKTEYN